MAAQLSLLYTTFGSKEGAIRVSRDLLEKRLIASANIVEGMHSLYLWEGRVEENKETGVFFKTTPEKISTLMSALQELHPYDIPAMLEISLNHTNEAFVKWAQTSMR